MPRKKKTSTDPESITVDLTPSDIQPIPGCSQCLVAFTWRDHAYGASSRNLCRTHDQQRQRAALRGNYLMRQTPQGWQPAMAGPSNRAMRRAEMFGRRTAPTLRYAA